MLDAARTYTTPCGLLKQPDKQKRFSRSSNGECAIGFTSLFPQKAAVEHWG
jgi:hypothetical protein